jgi:uncharacterized protein
MPAAQSICEETGQWLVGWCRRVIEDHLNRRSSHKPPVDLPDALLTPGACFVTLRTLGGQLRGCIGTFNFEPPLWKNCFEMSIGAATRDPRFIPMTVLDLKEARLELSLLEPPRKTVVEEISLGLHGLIVSQGTRRGVLLPQVAIEEGFDLETFLAQTCRKAGLAPNAWRDEKTLIQSFGAQKISQNDV